MLTRNDLLSLYSDIHKDLYGVRPGFDRVLDLTDNQLLAKIDSMQEDLEAQMAKERESGDDESRWQDVMDASNAEIDRQDDEDQFRRKEEAESMPSAEEAELEKMPKHGSFRKLVKEEVKKALSENSEIKKAVLESRRAVICETLELDEASFIDKARQWFRNKYYSADQKARDAYRNDFLVNPKKIVSNEKAVENILKKSISDTQNQIRNFRASTLKTSNEINKLQDKVFDLFGKFFNLLDSIPMEKRGLFEREVMRVVSVFYNTLEEEKNRIEVYLSAMAREASTQGYNLGRSAEAMAGYRPEAKPTVVGSRVVEPENSMANLVGANT